MIRKAVIPAAGFGSRFLPATKAQPKEMLPVIDTPTIQYVIEETVKSGITQILIITGKGKQSIENHFDRSFQLEAELKRTNKLKQLAEMHRISSMAEIFYIRQKELNGLGDAIRYAKNFVGDEPFVVLLGDTIVQGTPPCVRQLIDVYNLHHKTILGAEEVSDEKVSRYGIIEGEPLAPGLINISTLKEKPEAHETESRLAIGGRYLLTPDIFTFLDKTPPGKNGEIQLTDALLSMAGEQDILAYKYNGKRFDIGNKLEYLKTSVELGVQHEEVGFEFKQFIKDFAARL